MTLLVTCASQDELAKGLLLAVGVIIAALLVAVAVILILEWRTRILVKRWRKQ